MAFDEYNELISLLPENISQSSDKEFINECLSGAGPIKVLDLGCGSGKTREAFQSINNQIEWFGVDIDDSYERKQLVFSDFDILRWDGRKIPLPDESLDVVYCHQVMEYVQFPHLVLREVARVLKHGGVFIGSTSQFEPCVTGSLWNYKPLGFKLLVNAAGLELKTILPGIDGVTLIARAFLGRPEYFSQFFSKESPLNTLIEMRGNSFRLPSKQIILEKIRYCGQFSFKAIKPIKPFKRMVPVIVYHRHVYAADIANDNPSFKTYTNTIESFVEQMRWLHENGYKTLTLSEFEEFIDGVGIQDCDKKILITFDDGYSSVVNYCYPVLKKYGFTAVVFLITGKLPEKMIDTENNKSLYYISKGEIDSLTDVFEFGGHTHNLHSRHQGQSALLTADREIVLSDVETNRSILKGTRHFCFPYGLYDENAINLIATAGFKYFYTLNPSHCSPKPNAHIKLIERINIGTNCLIDDFARLVRIQKFTANAWHDKGNVFVKITLISDFFVAPEFAFYMLVNGLKQSVRWYEQSCEWTFLLPNNVSTDDVTVRCFVREHDVSDSAESIIIGLKSKR